MIEKDFAGKGRVAVLRTQPETVLDDYQRLLSLAGYQDALPKDHCTLLKINISWQQWYPACSTAPWQLEGVVRALQAGGYEDLVAAHNRTVVVDAYVGERNNKHKLIVDKYRLRNVHLYEPEVEWVRYEPRSPMLVLDKVYPEGIKVPRYFFDKNIVQLPTVKTHVFTGITGAMKNAFGGLLSEQRHWTHGVIHETVVDLLAIQQEIHSGLFAVMDGTFVGDGPGPRAMWVQEKDLILASADQVAIDAVSAYLQGFDPMELRFIRLAHERGLGIGDIKQIEVLGGLDLDEMRWHARTGDTFASWGQKQIYHGPLRPLEHLLLRTPIVPWAYLASEAYYDGFWYPFVGHGRVKGALKSRWGRLFAEYESQPPVTKPLYEPKTAAVGILGMAASALAIWWLASRKKQGR
ncbi:MAG TPA: DUF362 domain-containing protein [Anaerolineae bacterium]|nr:DUF362 domain-containing protein [Anaerolineae bacterium]